MQQVGCQWYIVGGWALDLWHGHQTRDHDDIELCVLVKDAPTILAHLIELTFYAAHKGRLTALRDRTTLPSGVTQFWGYDALVQAWRVDVMIEQGTPQTWTYKRDLAVTLPRDTAILTTAQSIPYLAPQIVLLFKAKHCRPKDQLDFEMAFAKLKPDQKSWLRARLG
jgi:hypothetical protein